MRQLPVSPGDYMLDWTIHSQPRFCIFERIEDNQALRTRDDGAELWIELNKFNWAFERGIYRVAEPPGGVL